MLTLRFFEAEDDFVNASVPNACVFLCITYNIFLNYILLKVVCVTLTKDLSIELYRERECDVSTLLSHSTVDQGARETVLQ